MPGLYLTQLKVSKAWYSYTLFYIAVVCLKSPFNFGAKIQRGKYWVSLLECTFDSFKVLFGPVCCRLNFKVAKLDSSKSYFQKEKLLGSHKFKITFRTKTTGMAQN